MKKIVYILALIIFGLCMDKINAYTEYKIGDVVPYNGMNFYVIKNSDSKEDTVTMLKAEPLTVAEVNQYGGVGTENNHVNMYNASSGDSYYRTAYNQNGYGGMTYYSSPTWGYNGTDWVYDECKTDYAQSEVKYVVDAWKAAKAPGASEVRLITIDELKDNLGYDVQQECTGSCYQVGRKSDNTPAWVYNNNYWYWTMSQYQDSASRVWNVSSDGNLYDGVRGNGLFGVVRPVITLKKTALGDIDESIVDDKEKEDTKIDAKDNLDDNKSNESKTIVKVANTYMSSSIIIIILGFIIASISVFLLYKVRNKSIK